MSTMAATKRSVVCPQCDAKYAVSSKLARKKLRCQGCGHRFAIDDGASPPEAAVADADVGQTTAAHDDEPGPESDEGRALADGEPLELVEAPAPAPRVITRGSAKSSRRTRAAAGRGGERARGKETREGRRGPPKPALDPTMVGVLGLVALVVLVVFGYFGVANLTKQREPEPKAVEAPGVLPVLPPEPAPGSGSTAIRPDPPTRAKAPDPAVKKAESPSGRPRKEATDDDLSKEDEPPAGSD